MLTKMLKVTEEKIKSADYLGAIQTATSILNSSPRCLPAYIIRAEAKKYIGQYDSAIGDLSRIISLNQNYAHLYNIYQMLAEIKKMKGDESGAIRDAQHAAQATDKSNYARQILTQITQKSLDTCSFKHCIDTNTYSSLLAKFSSVEEVETLSMSTQTKKELEQGNTAFALVLSHQNQNNAWDQKINQDEETASAFAQNDSLLATHLAKAKYSHVSEINADVEKAIEIAETLFFLNEVDVAALIALDNEKTFAAHAWQTMQTSMLLSEISSLSARIAAAHITQKANKKLADKCYSDAIELTTAAIQLDVQYSFAYAVRFEAKCLVENYDAALEDITQFIHFHPHYEFSYKKRAIIYLIMKNFEKAIVDLDRALALNPIQDVSTYQLRAEAYRAVDKLGKALLDKYMIYRLQKKIQPLSLQILTKFFILEKHGHIMGLRISTFKNKFDDLRKSLIVSGITPDTIAAIRAYQGYPTMASNLFDKIDDYDKALNGNTEHSAKKLKTI